MTKKQESLSVVASKRRPYDYSKWDGESLVKWVQTLTVKAKRYRSYLETDKAGQTFQVYEALA